MATRLSVRVPLGKQAIVGPLRQLNLGMQGTFFHSFSISNCYCIISKTRITWYSLRSPEIPINEALLYLFQKTHFYVLTGSGPECAQRRSKSPFRLSVWWTAFIWIKCEPSTDKTHPFLTLFHFHFCHISTRSHILDVTPLWRAASCLCCPLHQQSYYLSPYSLSAGHILWQIKRNHHNCNHLISLRQSCKQRQKILWECTQETNHCHLANDKSGRLHSCSYAAVTGISACWCIGERNLRRDCTLFPDLEEQ